MRDAFSAQIKKPADVSIINKLFGNASNHDALSINVGYLVTIWYNYVRKPTLREKILQSDICQKLKTAGTANYLNVGWLKSEAVHRLARFYKRR